MKMPPSFNALVLPDLLPLAAVSVGIFTVLELLTIILVAVRHVFRRDGTL